MVLILKIVSIYLICNSSPNMHPNKAEAGEIATEGLCAKWKFKVFTIRYIEYNETIDSVQ